MSGLIFAGRAPKAVLERHSSLHRFRIDAGPPNISSRSLLDKQMVRKLQDLTRKAITTVRTGSTRHDPRQKALAYRDAIPNARGN